MNKYYHKKDDGIMKKEWGNGFGVMYRCTKCKHFAIMPTDNQIKVRPDNLPIDLKRNKLGVIKL